MKTFLVITASRQKKRNDRVYRIVKNQPEGRVCVGVGFNIEEDSTVRALDARPWTCQFDVSQSQESIIQSITPRDRKRTRSRHHRRPVRCTRRRMSIITQTSAQGNEARIKGRTFCSKLIVSIISAGDSAYIIIINTKSRNYEIIKLTRI